MQNALEITKIITKATFRIINLQIDHKIDIIYDSNWKDNIALSHIQSTAVASSSGGGVARTLSIL